MNQKLPKTERLHGETSVSQLFMKGKGFSVFPLRVVYLKRNDSLPDRIVASVSKKRFKHAVDRNRVKRLIRETFRKNKPCMSLDIGFIFLSNQIPSYLEMESAMHKVVAKLKQTDRAVLTKE